MIPTNNDGLNILEMQIAACQPILSLDDVQARGQGQGSVETIVSVVTNILIGSDTFSIYFTLLLRSCICTD